MVMQPARDCRAQLICQVQKRSRRGIAGQWQSEVPLSATPMAGGWHFPPEVLTAQTIYGGLHKWGSPKLDGLQRKIPLKWMIGGTPISGNPYIYVVATASPPGHSALHHVRSCGSGSMPILRNLSVHSVAMRGEKSPTD